MAADLTQMSLRLFAALVAGALIGIERSYRGRPAGFRTHTLVCMASSVLMLITVYEGYWVHGNPMSVRLDPTRMAQGIMTGIGFLGAGVIMQERYTVRGLTTAASIWMTAAIGILAGIGFYFPLALATAAALGVLSGFRWIENNMPTQAYFHFEVRCARKSTIDESHIRSLVEAGGFSIGGFSHRLDAEGQVRRFTMTIASADRKAASRLARTLEDEGSVLEFQIAPTGD